MYHEEMEVWMEEAREEDAKLKVFLLEPQLFMNF